MGQFFSKLSLFIADTISWFSSKNGSKSVQDNQRFQSVLKNDLSSLGKVEEITEPLIKIQEYSHVLTIHEEGEHHVPSATEQFTESCQEIDIFTTKDIVEEKSLVITISDAGASKENETYLCLPLGSSLPASALATVADSLNINPPRMASDSSERRTEITSRSYAGVMTGRNNIERKENETEGDKQRNTNRALEKVNSIIQVKEIVDEVKREVIWMRDYCSSHKTLLVGEGDFSFSVCLAKAFGSATNMVATSLDSSAFLEENYPSSKSHIGYLKKRGCTVIHEVDATKMAENIDVNGFIYDRVIFNFPLAGFFSESKKIQLKHNRNLVRLFFENANRLIADDGEVHIRHKSSSFYREWNLENMASQSGFKLIEDEEFNTCHYRGYNIKYGFGGNENFSCNPSRKYKFVLKRRKVDEVKREGIWMRDYYSSHKILLVGEGDFSFSVCLAKAFGSATNMVATSLDSSAFLEENYPSAKSHIGYLKKRGCTVIHKVDATKMAENIDVNDFVYDRIIFNFPLAGFFRESKKNQLKRNRNLVGLFFENANRLIADDGQVHIRHKSNSFYREWNLENLANKSGFKLMEDEEFNLSHYRGYNNKYGFGGNENFNCYPSRTYKFVLK